MTVTMNGKYTYRNGEPVRVLCTDRPDKDGYCVVAIAIDTGRITTHDKNGIDFPTGEEGKLDLIEAWEPKEGELCCFWDGSRYSFHIARFSHISEMGRNRYVTASGVGFDNCSYFDGNCTESFLKSML